MTHDLPHQHHPNSSSSSTTPSHSVCEQRSSANNSLTSTTEPSQLLPLSQSDMPLSTGKRRTFTSNMNLSSLHDSSTSTNQKSSSTNAAGTGPPNNSSSNSNSNNVNNSKVVSIPLLNISANDNALSLKQSLSTNSSDDPIRITSLSRRRKFIVYTLAFAVMLAMSSVLDVRRAALRNRHAKLQLSLPSASLSSLSDEIDSSTTKLDPDLNKNSNLDDSDPNSNQESNIHQQQPRQNEQLQNPVSVEKLTPHTDKIDDKIDSSSSTTTTVTGPTQKHEYKISQQELDDGVDQLIAHVDQEENALVSSSLNNSTSVNSNDIDPNSHSSLPENDRTSQSSQQNTDISNSNTPSLTHDSKGSTVSSSTSTTSSTDINSDSNNSTSLNEDVKLNAEDTFHAAVTRLNELLKDEKYKTYVDENDLRTLKALELQATRGDCELKSGSSLFKTDIEAASNVDIERTHPLWGAWCLFMGSYKSDAMRDYVTKELVVEQKIINLKNNSTLLSTLNNEKFDPNQASLDDVMTSEQQSTLRKQTELVIDHLQENDLRHLAALSLQATFGDCGPYGKEITITQNLIGKDGNGNIINTIDSTKSSLVTINEKDLRKLREPLLEQTVTRKKGALWGAWCVMQGKKRSAAAAILSQRIESLVDQLTKSKEAAAAEEEAKNSDSDFDVSSHTSDSSKIDHVTRIVSHADEEVA